MIGIAVGAQVIIAVCGLLAGLGYSKHVLEEEGDAWDLFLGIVVVLLAALLLMVAFTHQGRP